MIAGQPQQELEGLDLVGQPTYRMIAGQPQRVGARAGGDVEAYLPNDRGPTATRRGAPTFPCPAYLPNDRGPTATSGLLLNVSGEPTYRMIAGQPQPRMASGSRMEGAYLPNDRGPTATKLPRSTPLS